MTLCDLCRVEFDAFDEFEVKMCQNCRDVFPESHYFDSYFFCVRFDAVNDFRIEFAVPRALQLQKRAVKTRPSEKKAPTLEICTFYTG